MKDKQHLQEQGLSLSRRAVLGGAVTLMAAPAALGALSSERSGDGRVAPNPDSGESRAIAEHIATTTYEQLTPKAAVMARRSILDAIGVSMAAAALEPACKPFLDLAMASGEGPAVIAGTGQRAGLVMAALANGALAHALDYEDSHDRSYTHPNAAPVAAALTLADGSGGISGREFVTAVALGCDLVCRLSMAQGNVGVPPKAYYPPAIVGTFGATATAARLLGLDARQTLDAFSLSLCANSCSAAILFSPYSDIRAIRDGLCAQTGVQSALLASRGVQGFDAPFEGRGGFFDMYSQGLHAPGVLTDELGKRYEGEFVGYKAWPACRATHVYIQAIFEGLERESVDIEQIENVHAYVKESDLIICEPAEEKRRPRAAIDAKFSLYYVLARAFIDREISFPSFEKQALSDQAVLALGDRVTYEVDEQRARSGAEGGGALLVVTLKDGSTHRWGIDRLYGSPENPMSDEALVDKFVDCGLASPRQLDEQTLRELAATLLSLEQVDEMRKVTQLL